MTKNKTLEALIELEQQRADSHGDRYNTDHEFFGVIYEEAGELSECESHISCEVSYMQKNIQKHKDITKNIDAIEKNAINAIHEAAQIVSNCRKARRGFVK